MNRQKNKLYRKVNTKAINVHHNFGSDAKHERNTKKGMSEKMKQGVKRGLDYTPLYRFLLSKVGQDFDKIHSEAVARLDGNDDPIYHIVRRPNQPLRSHEANWPELAFTNCGESSIYSELFIDENNLLQIVDPNLRNENFQPSCPCCTHTFNGKPLIRKFNPTGERPENVYLV